MVIGLGWVREEGVQGEAKVFVDEAGRQDSYLTWLDEFPGSDCFGKGCALK